MRRAIIYPILLLAASTHTHAQDVADWYPLHVGDTWTYLHTARDENGEGREHLVVRSWKTEEITSAISTIPEGSLVERQVRVIGGSLPTGSEALPHPASLIRGDCLYENVGWDFATHQLTPEFRKALGTYEAPALCFPLAVHKTWGAPHGLPDWGVSRPEDAKDWKVAGLQIRDRSFHIISISAYPGSGMTVDIWFQRGVGVVREVEIHHGTIGERRRQLLHFEAATRR